MRSLMSNLRELEDAILLLQEENAAKSKLITALADRITVLESNG